MALPNSREEFKKRCLYNLGDPVISINVDDDQVENRIDEALDFWRNFNHDAVQKVPFKHQITANNITDKYIAVNNDVIAIERILPMVGSSGITSGSSLFDLQYQIRLNDYLTYKVTNPVDIYIMQTNLDLIDQVFNGEAPVQFNRHMNRIYPYWDWANDVSEGDWIIIECLIALDGDTFTDIWTDRILTKYATALIKLQWGNNLKKFSGTKLLGGVTMDGQQMYNEAIEEIDKIEKEMRETYEEPPHFICG
jgi:hypothetical protein